MKKQRANKQRTNYSYQFLLRPGTWMSDEQIASLVTELRLVASSCFATIPQYQCLAGTRDELADKIIVVARRPDGAMGGFCSMLLLHAPGVGEVVHLGLTCVAPADRSAGLTHELSHRALSRYMMRCRPLGRIWITNCAAVLSSLGNVAMHFDDVYPSPFHDGPPSRTHLAIAVAVNEYYRHKIYINDDAVFDFKKFVFRGSVKETVFQKDQDDRRYHHRDNALNLFYSGLMEFSNGDEVLQIGHASILTSVKHGIRRAARVTRKPRQIRSAA